MSWHPNDYFFDAVSDAIAEDWAEYELDLEAMQSDDSEWWREQDQELEREELEAIERQAEIEEYRHNGYM